MRDTGVRGTGVGAIGVRSTGVRGYCCVRGIGVRDTSV